MAGAAVINPTVHISNGLFENSIETTFTPDYLTKSSDTAAGVLTGKYVKNSWVQIVEGADVRYARSKDYFRPDSTWVHTKVSLGDNPFQTAVCTHGWNYQ